MQNRYSPLRLFASSAVFFFLIISGCGGGAPKQPVTTSQIAKRAFVSNQVVGQLQIVDAQKDALSLTHSIIVGASPTFMVESPNKMLTLVFNSGSNSISIVSNATEAQIAIIQLPDFTDSIVISPDNKFAFVAVRNAGLIEVIDLTTGALTTTPVAVSNVRHLSLSHNGSTLLAFPDNSDTVFSISTANLAAGATPIPAAGQTSPFSRPVQAVFSSDDSTAYILSCGQECGGLPNTTSVTALAISNSKVGMPVSVAGATVGLMDTGGNLYVAGGNTLQVITMPALTAGNPVVISDGIHNLIALGSNGQLFIGSHACTDTGAAGCLTIFNVGTGKAAIQPAAGDVTGIEPIPGRNVVYVCVGGELVVYDTTMGTPSSPIDIVGKAIDVREVF